jgi:hypothetical protein
MNIKLSVWCSAAFCDCQNEALQVFLTWNRYQMPHKVATVTSATADGLLSYLTPLLIIFANPDIIRVSREVSPQGCSFERIANNA